MASGRIEFVGMSGIAAATRSPCAASGPDAAVFLTGLCVAQSTTVALVAFTVEADEVDNFVTAVAGLTIDYVRTDRGHGPSRTTCAGSRDAQLSVGSMGFSAIASTEVPGDLVVFALITSAPPGSVWCGQELHVGQLYVYGPGTVFHAIEPAGLAATMLTVLPQPQQCARRTRIQRRRLG